MKRIFESLFVVFILIICLLPAVFFERHSDVVSVIDNDYLPEYSGLRNRTAFQNWFAKRIGFREEMIRSYMNLNVALFHEIDHPDYFLGKDGYIFISESETSYNNYHDDFVSFLTRLNHYLEEKGIPFYVMFDPSKNSVYNDHLYDYQKVDKEWIDIFVQKLKGNGITVVNNTEILRESKKTGRPFDTRNDPHHWNDFGALIGINHLFEIIEKDFPSVSKLTQNEYTVRNEFIERGLNTTLQINDSTENYDFETHYIDCSEEWRDKIEISEIFNEFRYYKMPESDGPRLLVFEGSYLISNDRNKYLLPRFSEVIGIHNYENIFRADYYVETFKPDLVVFEVAEYTIGEYFFGQWYMQNNLIDY